MLVTERGYIEDSADFGSYRSIVSNLYFVDYESFNLSNPSLTLTKVMQTLVRLDLLIIDKLGFVPFSENGARLHLMSLQFVMRKNLSRLVRISSSTNG